MKAQSDAPQRAAAKGGRCRLRRRECAGDADERWGCRLRKTAGSPTETLLVHVEGQIPYRGVGALLGQELVAADRLGLGPQVVQLAEDAGPRRAGGHAGLLLSGARIDRRRRCTCLWSSGTPLRTSPSRTRSTPSRNSRPPTPPNGAHHRGTRSGRRRSPTTAASIGRPEGRILHEISSCKRLNCGPSFDDQSRFRETPDQIIIASRDIFQPDLTRALETLTTRNLMQKRARSSTEPAADATQQRDNPPDDPSRPWQAAALASSRAST